MSTQGLATWRGLLAVLCALAWVSSGCADEVRSSEDLPAVVLEGPLVAVPRTLEAGSLQRLREGLGSVAPGLQGSEPGTFYLALRKSELGKRWFMSVYLQQSYPEDLAGNGGSSLGVRVVSFREQNGKLYAFDVDDTKVRSTLYTPEEIVEAWPLVDDHPGFKRLPGADQYLLFDPAAGLDRVMGMDALSQELYGPAFEVELGFAQRFLALKDGVSFEKVFTGHGYSFDEVTYWPEPTPIRVTATVGVALRRYQEGEGFTPTPRPAREHYFRSAPRIVPDSGGLTEQSTRKWNIRPGMKPIVWVMSDTLKGTLTDPRYRDYDVIGAVKRGVENWNQAFGFPVFTARMAQPGESFSDDDKNFILFDPDPSYAFAFANTRSNPNTGETLGASVYMNVSWLDRAIEVIHGMPSVAEVPAPLAPGTKAIQLSWNGMAAAPMCDWRVADLEANLPGPGGWVTSLTSAGGSLTPQQRVERFFTYVVMHEVGHTLGLRHNFKGSLGLPSYSVMEYAWAPEQELRGGEVGPYDVAAVRYLYGLSSTLPQEPFCTDEETRRDPDCTRYDATAVPLELFHGAAYQASLQAALKQGGAQPDDTMLNGVQQYVRAGRSSTERVRAWNILFEGLQAPIPPDVLAAYPGYGAVADAMARRVLQRLYLDDISLLGSIWTPVRPDPVLTPLVLAQLRANLLNLDGVRTFATRRVMVSILKQLQTYEAFAILREARLALEAQLPGLSGQELLAAEDLAARVHQATSPYFL
ncbi:zinc-dependent metalloprotease [Myxococcus qinghaiensis]|uniref:zinc-dependent metalloprotease n=1 Tax=Myxococcus qinghaiensis TaxID=2906758 RepID=UPI0020A7A2EE|nr:zinc-dependent metalloprotease [Myxococcus qinghaiensis]MCP3168744.1 zinc-dependent metalloprotease [Myxococcus qinghaiensis]